VSESRRVTYQQAESLRNTGRHRECARWYGLIRAFWLDGPVDVARLAAAIRAVARRHAALRTTIAPSVDGFAQTIHDDLVEDVALGAVEENAQTRIIDELRASQLSFDELCDGRALFRPRIDRVGSRHLLSAIIHHLIHDGWSEGILWRDLSAFYNADLDGVQPDLPELTRSYADFADWQHQMWAELRPDTVPRWRSVLSGYGWRPCWPTPVGPTPRSSLATGIVEFHLGVEASTALRTAARELRITPYLMLLTVSAMAIGEVDGRRDILIGSNTANREESFKQHLVGHFVNMRMTRVAFGSGQPIESVARDVRDSWLGEEPYREVYSGELLAALENPYYVPLNFLGSLRETPAAPDLAGVTTTAYVAPPAGPPPTWHHLSIFWNSDDAGFGGFVIHRLATVDPATVAAVVSHLGTLAGSVRTRRPPVTTSTTSRC
jgi:hypothetical protein